MSDFHKVKDFFSNLNFDIDIEKYQNQNGHLCTVVVKINKEKVYVDIRHEIRPNHTYPYINLSKNYSPLLVASDYITPNAKEFLKQNKINYIDSFGNVFLNLKNLKIYVEQGNAKPVYNKYSDVFTQAGGQILFHLLQDPGKINDTYRHLAEISNVSLGSVSKTINGLLNEGFAVKWSSDKKYQLVRREELLEKWVSLLNEKILPAYRIGTYSFSKNRFEIIETDPEFETLWGSESGAAMLTSHLNPEKYSLFTNRPKQDLIKNYRLIPKEDGEITIYRPFWKQGSCCKGHEDSHVIAHPLLIYAELLYSKNDRNLETVKIIFDEYIKPNL